jgi:hypothetical protein
MRHTKFMKLGAALAIAAGGVVAALGPSLPALAFVSGPLFLDVQAESPARLVARGAAVDVPLEVTCTATSPASVSVRLTQRVNGGLAQGTGSTLVGCTGRHQQIIVRVTASAEGQAFRAKNAVADSSIFGCVTDFCGDEQDSTVINVRR